MSGSIRKPTAWDVAERAGVSQSTVSRALTGSPSISEDTRNRVVAAASALDYLPDKRASRLRSGQTGVLAVVMVTRADHSAHEVNPFAYVLLGSVCRAASDRGYEAIVSFQAEADKFYGRYVEQRDADALIVIGTTQNPAAWKYFRPILEAEDRAICWGLPFDAVNSVHSDNHRGGLLAAQHLWDRGYRKPVFLGPVASAQRQFQQRYDGFAEAWQALGGHAQILGDMTDGDRVEQGREAIARLQAQKTPYDSIFAACDFIALGALEALTELGLSVPDDVGIVGYDGIAATDHSNPPLTTIKPNLEEAGRLLVARAIDSAANEDARLAPVELIARGSTARR